VTERSPERGAETREDRARRVRTLLAQWNAEFQERELEHGQERELEHGQEHGLEHGQAADRRKPGDQVIWQYLARPPRGPRPALSHDQIAAAAVRIADADGLDAVTMRALAKRLDVATMGLYRYVRGKDDIFALMLNAVAAEIDLPAAGTAGWRDTFRRIAHETRAMHLRHPWLARLQHSTAAMLAPNMLAIAEAGLTALDAVDLDLDVDQMMSACGALSAYVQGKAAAEVALREAFRRYGWSSYDDMRAAAAPHLLSLLARGEYPTLAHYIVDGSNEDDVDWSFAFGLECVLDGIAARLGL
jgi:AcrR family transcriptional regulator